MTAEISAGVGDSHFTSEKVSFITDEIIVQRYVEIEGELQRVIAIIKMRGSDHSHEFRTYQVTANGVVVGGTLKGYDGIITGVPTLRAKPTKAKRGK